MKLSLRRLRIQAETGEGPYGLDLSLGDGLTVIRADNSMGKSTVANALLYALGGEGMLGPGWPNPLKYCLYEHLIGSDGEKHPVLESQITAELENEHGQDLSVRRHVLSSEFDRFLVQLWDGRVLSEPATARRRDDAFLRTSGSASRPAGFHTQLTEFIGWDLPNVTRYDGSTAPLYLQLLLPFLFVEQQHGWSGVRANVPRFMQVRDPGRRAVEFLLALDANQRSQRREELRAKEAHCKQRWSEAIAEFAGLIRSDPVRVRELPEKPTSGWPPSPPPALEVLTSEQWVSIDSALETLRSRLAELSEREIPTVKAAAAETEARLGELEAQHRRLGAARTRLVHELGADQADLDRIDSRLRALTVDRRRHQDAQRIAGLGGEATDLEDGRCPTCDQDWPADLLGGSRDGEPIMTIAEHLELIDQEDRSLKALRKGAEATLDEQRARERALREQLAELRADIRAHRATLLADARGPSAAAIREQLLAEDRIRRIEELRLELVGLLECLEGLSEEYKMIRAGLAELSGIDLSPEDRERLSAFSKTFLEQLAEYGFSSLDGVTVSEQTLLPEREGFDLTHEVSASDTIRLIWAYLHGLLETGRAFATNHPGLLVLDEPGQQDIEDESLREFLARAAATDGDCQVLITITRPLSRVDSAQLAEATTIDFGAGNHVLQPLRD